MTAVAVLQIPRRTHHQPTLLAPDIVEAIVNGEEPSGLSLERLTKGMPMVWEEQRKKLGFPAR